MRNLLTFHYLIADPAGDRRSEVRADANGNPEPGSSLGYRGPTVIARVRRVLTVETYGQCTQSTRLGVVHVLMGPAASSARCCEHCGGPLTPAELRNCDVCRGYRYPDAFSALRRTPAPTMPRS